MAMQPGRFLTEGFKYETPYIKSEIMWDWLKNISLFKQLIIPMLIVGVVGLSSTIYSAFMLRNSIVAHEKMHEDGGRKIALYDSAEASIAHFRTFVLRHLASESAVSMTDIESKLAKTKRDINDSIQSIGSSYQDVPPGVAAKMRVLQGSVSRYFKQINEVIKQSADFEKELAFELMTHVEPDYNQKILTIVQDLKRHEYGGIAMSREAHVLAAQHNLFAIVVTGTLVGSLLLVIAFVVIGRITRRLSMLVNWSRDISNGNWSTSLVSRSGDEVGQLTLAMEEMKQNIQIAHKEIAKAKIEAERVADDLQLYAKAFENSGEAILISDRQNRIINVNNAFTKQTGYNLDDVVGKDPRMFASGNTPENVFHEMWGALEKESFWQGELWDRKKSGEIYPKSASISAIRNHDNEVMFYIASFTDITERKDSQAQIEHLAHHDILTGLQNRYSLEDRLEQLITIAKRDSTLMAVFFIDLDRFKNINDSLGHQVGDRLLVEVAGRLRSCVRESDVVARIGGDEFVVVLTGMKDATQAAVIAETILLQVSTPYELGPHSLETSPSIGISIYPNDGASVEELLRNADVAMYDVKEKGRNNYSFFSESMLVIAQERLTLEGELRSALENAELELHYQPQVHVVDRRIYGVEALLRWSHPVQGEIPPAKFIPIAEDIGVIRELEEWVFDEACRQLAIWKEGGVDRITMSINLSAKNLHSSWLSEIIRATLVKHGLHGSELEFEITEAAAMLDPELVVQQLNALCELGITLAIDDFGTGYSSLAYLKRLPIQTLKLDKTFVRDIEHDQNDAEISTATIELAHSLGLRVVAEGVETQGQYEFLIENNCDYLQGYLFSRPLPAHEATKYLHGGASSMDA
ncbi:MAG: EAL domain-containing protein [Gammaproteobacteria bacterium]|nr:EAL domain-containing protein [Gammaproteobacteria bacterium]